MILLNRTDAGYAEEIAPYNTRIVHTPDAVAAPVSVDEIIEAVAYAQERGLKVHPQAAGHVDAPIRDGLLISTKHLTGMSVDADAQTATVQAGVRWGQLIKSAEPHGRFAISGSSPTVSVVGLMLGGGLGPLARSHGFSSDYMAGATVVTSSGDVLAVDANNDPDLFWALRGGKVVPGIVADMTLRLVDLPTMYAGALYFAEADIEGVLRGWIDWTRYADPNVTTSAALFRLPPLETIPAAFRGRKLLALRFAYPGRPEDGARLADPLRRLATVYVDDLGDMPSAQVARIHNDPPEPGPAMITATLLSHVDQKLASVLLDLAGPDVDTPFGAVEIRHLGEATAFDVPEGSAVAGRSAAFTLGAVCFDPSRFASVPGVSDLLIDELLPWTASEGNPNFMGAPRSREQWANAWPPAIRTRLDEVSRRYDPDGLFG